ncbi:MAG: dienelactone hydrolase family protein, partial [Acidobacteriota bacterium]
MERKKASDFPPELLNLLDLYVHGDMDRRDFIENCQRFATGGISAAMLFESLRPNYAWAQQVPADDKRITTSTTVVESPAGNGSIRGFLAMPARPTGKLGAVIVIHENRGLNPYIEDVARRLAVENFLAFAPDGLTSVGGYPGDDERGAKLFQSVDREKMTEDFVAVAQFLKILPGGNGKLGAVGFCFGGGISNTLAVRLGPMLNAAAPFYGAQPRAEDVSRIQCPLL